MSSQSQNDSQQEAFDFKTPPSSMPTVLTIDLDDNTQESDLSVSPTEFSTDPGKQYALWKPEYSTQWQSWWTLKLQGGLYEGQFKRIPWAKPKRSSSWNPFYQAVEIKTGAARAICRNCWKVYSYPEGHNSGSSTSTLARHNSKCLLSKNQRRIDNPTLIVSFIYTL